MSRPYYTSTSTTFQYTATGDSSSGGGSGSGMECLQLRSPPAPFHYHISDQAKSFVALQELQNEVGALLEFRDLVIETFPNLRSKLASGGTSVTGTGGGVRRDWEPGVRVRRKVPARDADSLPRSRSDSHSKPQTKGDGAHSVVQDSGFSTETSSSKEAHSAQAASTARASSYEPDLWQMLDVIQAKCSRLRDDNDALRVTLNDRRSHSLSELCSPERDPSDEFRRALAVGSTEELDALRRERDLLLHRIAELETETITGRAEAERLRGEGDCMLTPARKRDFEERLRSRPSAPGPLRGTSRSSVFSPVKSLHDDSDDSPLRTSSSVNSVSDGDGDGEGEGEVSSAFRAELGKLDKVMNTPVRNLKVKTPDSRKFAAILREDNPIELQRHLLAFTVHNQILRGKLEEIDRFKGNLVERLHRTREENDDLKFQLEEKTIELEGSRAQVRLLESGGRRISSSAPRSMRALQPLPLHLQLDEDIEIEADVEPETNCITDTPRRKPSKIPLPPSKQPISGLVPKPPTGRTKDSPSYRSRSGDSIGRPGSAQSWRNKSDINNSLSGSKSGNSISSTKCPGGGRNSSFITSKTSNKESLSRCRDFKHSKDSLTGKVRNNDSLSRIRDSNLSNSNSVLSNASKKELSGSVTPINSKKSSVPVRRASSGSSVRTGSTAPKPNRVLLNSWMRNGLNGTHNSHGDSLSSEQLEQETVQTHPEERQLLQDFIKRSNQLAEDKRILYLTSNLYHRNVNACNKFTNSKEELEYAYASPNVLKMHLSNSYIDPKRYFKNDLMTMDVSTLHNSPTKSDVLFFNQPLHHSYQSVWSKKPLRLFDSINNSVQIDSNYCSTLQSITNDSVKREGLAECDSLEKKISFDENVW